jgi:hypothetical protein
MSQLSLMIEKGTDIPLFGTLAFPMKDRLYKQVRDLVLGKSAMVKQEPFVNLLHVGDNVWWSEGDSKLIGNIQSITNDGLTADVICPDGTRMCVATKILHYDGK